MTTPTLSQITVYPIKSLGGVGRDLAAVEARGLQWDRRWMLVDAAGVFLSQRECPSMARLSVSIREEGLQVSATGRASLFVPYCVGRLAPVTVRVWRSICEAVPVGSEADAWFSEALGRPCRLVFMPETTRRFVNPEYAVGEDIVSFADGYPILLIGDASLGQLNTWLNDPLPMDRFRPNLVVSGASAFAEDGWKQIRIGEALFHVVKPCDRCAITTIDQQTGEPDGPEPLRTLAQLRRQGDEVLFGQYLIPMKDQSVRLGDEVEVIARRDV